MSHIGADFTNVYLVRRAFFVLGYSDETSPLFSLKLSRVESPGRPPGRRFCRAERAHRTRAQRNWVRV